MDDGDRACGRALATALSARGADTPREVRVTMVDRLGVDERARRASGTIWRRHHWRDGNDDG